ncbi:MAG: hypothetical protein ABSG53_06000 [Thermoguttaceae bacterium]|jgi:hypothetical protein
MREAKHCVYAVFNVADSAAVHFEWGLAEDPVAAIREAPDGNSLSAGIANGTLKVQTILGDAVRLSARTATMVVGLLRGRQRRGGRGKPVIVVDNGTRERFPLIAAAARSLGMNRTALAWRLHDIWDGVATFTRR